MIRIILALSVIALTETPAQGTHVVHGTISDSARATPVSGAVVELRGGAIQRAGRTDETGEFRLTRIPPGSYQMTVRRIGYAEFAQELRVPDRDFVVDVRIAAIGSGLDTIRVRAGVTGIYGAVGTSPRLQPIVAAKVSVLGANEQATTDSAGRYFIALRKPGNYVVRISRDGYVPLVQSISVPRDRAVEASVILDSAATATPKGIEGLWDDFDQRLRWRAMNSAVISASELRRNARSSLTDALQASPSFSSRGLQIGASVCVFVDGVARPGLPLDAIDPADIEVIEVYGTAGDETATLQKRWPRNAPCGVQNRLAPRQGSPTGREMVRYASVWLRQ